MARHWVHRTPPRERIEVLLSTKYHGLHICGDSDVSLMTRNRPRLDETSLLGWEEVADYALEWATANATRRAGSHSPVGRVGHRSPGCELPGTHLP
jgi:hypothetical protein